MGQGWRRGAIRLILVVYVVNESFGGALAFYLLTNRYF